MQAYATPGTRLSPQLRLVDGQSNAPAPAANHNHDVLDQVLGHLAELVADRVAALLVEPRPERNDDWLDTRHAAEYLGISRDSVRRLAAEGSIPTEQAGVGCKLYFRRSELDRWRCAGMALSAATGRNHG